MRTLTVPTHGTVALGGTSAELLPANSRRTYAIIVNASDVGIWLALGVPAVIGTGIYLAAGGGNLTITEEALWKGAVNGIAASGSGKTVGTLDLQ